MCGIAGIQHFNQSLEDKGSLNAMLEALYHRGPDEEGGYRSGSTHIGMRRLKVVALENGAQPCVSDNGRFVIVFNGEIYNYVSLRDSLKKRGLKFKTDSDAEVIVNLYQEYGEDFYNKLEGMYAASIYDTHEDSILLVRDRAGKKPLYYSFEDSTLSFSSEMKSLLQSRFLEPKLNFSAIDYFLKFRVMPNDQSVFDNVHKVPPGSCIKFSKDGMTPFQHWSVRYSPSIVERTEQEWIDEVDTLLNKSIQSRLLAEVPVGTMLSGGLDSSLVTAIAQKQGKIHNLKTFSIGFKDAEFSELEYARKLAKDLGTDHYDYTIEPEEAIQAAHDLVKHFGEPFAFPSSIASYFMFKLAKEHVTVVLGGDAADELFGGYARYQLVQCFPNIPADMGLPRKVDLSSGDWSQDSFSDFYQSMLTDGLDYDSRDQLYCTAFKEQLAQERCIEKHQQYTKQLCSKSRHNLDMAMEYDFNHWMNEAQLVKVDIASMANSLEVRTPFLDRSLVTLASSIPTDFKIRDGKEKHLLYRVAEKYLPDYILERKKQELAVPLEKWLLSHLKEQVVETLLSEKAINRGLFDHDELVKFVTEFKPENSYALWTLYMLEVWFLEMFDKE
ncbi:asparagine synthase (glutamine-hydrolyzing) [Vibrio caribbeanicus]|uniref:asparagine synthase (glutamine-hydrolyzing) n=1 Tax=Vibrio caribbeanicus ATCC BAA-2122 TaxID=796620 RepID=E3BG35_9VIBR|nr:asparagine synthase (glutamine-hydrolyzing) [Vibrio caribbeanicus]EFP97960.1 asparagine synthase (glutamine-hydrolyzing) [Vibrio caribbeanicus ATCC BAA-2122]